MKNLILASIIGLFFFAACTKGEFLEQGDFFHLSNKGADMPVWVKGNFDSDVILITVHGGPSSTAGMDFTISEGFKYLEDDYLLVYWDQRFSGMTQGHYDQSTMNPDQFIEDTKKIVELIQHKYPNKKYFMIGHSWGGQLAAGYLGRDNHDAMFSGWIDLDGSIYGEMESELMKNWILDRVPEKLAEAEADVEFWQFIVDYYEENPLPGNYSEFIPYYYVSALEGDAYNWEVTIADNPIPYADLVFKSMYSFSYYVNSFGEKEDMYLWDNLNYTPEIESISIPSLMLWGAVDGVVPPEVGDYVFDHLATDLSMKKVVKIPECAHGPQNDQPEIFYEEVSNFIETYK